MNLLSKKCIPCEGGTPPLTSQKIQNLQGQLSSPWRVLENKKILRKYTFKDFTAAMRFVNKVAELAEHEGHHPDIAIHYNRVTLELWTHAIGGLSENDFIVAEKINALP